MKRRYKAGDWFRVCLGGAHDALGLIVLADRSRLFGYFFASNSSAPVTHDGLRRLRAQDAVLSCYFGGAGLEENRWPIEATSLPLRAALWPVAAGPRRYATPLQLEDELRARLGAAPAAAARTICEVRSPIDPASLEILAGGGVVQFSEALTRADLRLLARLVDRNRAVALRVHGPQRFDAAALSEFSSLETLSLECAAIASAGTLGSLSALRRLRVGPLRECLALEALHGLPHLQSLELRGPLSDVAAASQLAHLSGLRLIDTPPVRLAAWASAANLQRVELAHTVPDLDALPAIPSLHSLELREMQLGSIVSLGACTGLLRVALRGVRGLRELDPLACLPQLQALVIEAMPQLQVEDFRPIVALAPRLHTLEIDLGSRTKSREVYRMLRRGRTR